MWVTKFEIERTWCCLACWELCKPSANAVRPHLALVILSGSQEFSLHFFCLVHFWAFMKLRRPTNLRTKRSRLNQKTSETMQSVIQIADLQVPPTVCLSGTSAPLAQLQPIFGPRYVSCQVAGGCGKGQTFRHILPTVTLVVLASQNCNALICFHLLKVVFLQFIGLFTRMYSKKKSHDASRSAFYSVVEVKDFTNQRPTAVRGVCMPLPHLLRTKLVVGVDGHKRQDLPWQNQRRRLGRLGRFPMRWVFQNLGPLSNWDPKPLSWKLYETPLTCNDDINLFLCQMGVDFDISNYLRIHLDDTYPSTDIVTASRHVATEASCLLTTPLSLDSPRHLQDQ